MWLTQTDFLTFALLGKLQESCLKMEFDQIKSSAALMYDEFIQNAGESFSIPGDLMAWFL